MAIKIPCESCGKTLSAPDSAAGKRVRCPNCQAIQRLPAPASDVMEPEPILEPEAYSPPTDDPFEGLGAPTDPYAMAPEPPAYTPPPYGGGGGGGGGGEDRKPCPMCGEMIARTAMKCRFCNAIFDPKLQKLEYQRRRNMGSPGDDDLTGGEWVLAILCSGIGCIMGIIWMIQGKPKGKKMFFVSLGMSVLWNIIRFAAESARR